MKIQPILPLLVISIYWTCLGHNTCVASEVCLKDQQSLLLQLKKSFGFKNAGFSFGSSTKMNSWNQSVAYCDWSGVTCDGEGHVIGLDLSGESISGGFDNSSTMFCLRHLRSLNLASNNFNSLIPSTFNKLGNLTYLNLSYAGFVGQIPIEISQLTRLVTLDLSSLSYLTGQQLKLENPNLRKFVQTLTSIRQLYLDGVTITAQGQEWCNALLLLSNLQELSMSNCNISGPLLPSLTELENLKVVILDQNSLSSPVPETFASLKNLTTLSLSNCGLNGTFPEKIFQIITLSVIDISYNHELNGSFPVFSVNGSLRTIILRNTNFSGAIPPYIGNMVQLSKLDLSSCLFSGTLPSSLSNLRELSYLDLSLNNFTGPIPAFGMAKKLTYIDLSHNGLGGEILSPSCFGGLQNLVTINFGFNSIRGSIPSSLFTLPSLQKILLSNNQFSRLDELTNVSSSKLNFLDLSSNNISGPIPAFLFQLKGLSILQLSSNKFNGSMQLNELSEFRNLTTLDLSYNNLSVNANVTISFANFSSLNLASCNLKSFPGFLMYQYKLTTLDLSVNQIHGAVPNWIWKLRNLEVFNASHNFLTDLEGPLQNLTSSLVVLDLHNNQLQGQIAFPEFAAYVDYSNNRFSSVIPVDIGYYLSLTIYLSLARNNFKGNIPESICNASNLQVLDLSYNRIDGSVPPCLMSLTETLGVLNLGMNNLSGTIPDMFPVSCALRTLDLRGNMFHGQIPKSLANCSILEVFDLGNNWISDGFPCPLKSISTLRVLVLRNNKFHGPIACPKSSGTWKMLQIVDLAINNFNGTLPWKPFKTWEAMMHDQYQAVSVVNHIRFQVLQFGNKIYYQDSVTVTSKGQSMELVKILTVFTSIDFSSNQFEGEIPKELFDFKALYALNLSNNALSGRIPASIGNLKQLESLDLSNNSLEGEIPYELASLNFLSVLNLSLNHLVGMIPTGSQIQTFSNDSFIGNKGLCGPPLTATCKSNDNFRPTEAPRTESETKFDWQFVSTGVGFGVGAGLVVATLMIWEKGRKWSDNTIDRFLLLVLPMIGLTYTPIHDDDDDEMEDKNSDTTDEDDCNEDEDDNRGYPILRGRYCVFCSKLDITMKRAFHDPSCTCYHHSSTLSTSSHSSDSYSP